MSKNWWTLGPRLSEASWLNGGGGSALTLRVWRAYTGQLAASAFSSLEGRRRLSWLGFPAARSPSYGPRKQIVLLHVSSIKNILELKLTQLRGLSKVSKLWLSVWVGAHTQIYSNSKGGLGYTASQGQADVCSKYFVLPMPPILPETYHMHGNSWFLIHLSH